MLGENFNDLEVLNGNTLITHLAGHAKTLEHFSGIRAGTDRTGGAETVVLTVSLLTHTAETVTLNYALETFTFAGTNNIYETTFLEEFYSESISESGDSFERFELGQVSLRSHTGFLEVTGHRLSGVLLFLVDEANLNSLVTVFFKGFDLSDYARTYFDNSARNILSVGTENGCHSDFLS